jgi:hypothetical protein
LCPSSPSSFGEVSIITLVTLTLVALNPLAFFVALVAVVFTTLAVAVRRCLLSAANARPLAARLSSADAGATAASHPPAEPLLPLVVLYFIIADCYIVASAPAPFSHCCSRHHHCHRFVIVTAMEESVQKKKKAEKVYFYLRHNKLKKANLDQVLASQDLERLLTKKKNDGSHPFSPIQYYRCPIN